MNAPFKQRENIEMFLKGCESYGLVPQDLFQVNDLYENKNLYMVVDNLYALGGLAQRNGFDGPVIGKKMATQNKRAFDDATLKAGQSVIGLQYGSNKGASQAGMTAYGTGRQIRPEGGFILYLLNCTALKIPGGFVRAVVMAKWPSKFLGDVARVFTHISVSDLFSSTCMF